MEMNAHSGSAFALIGCGKAGLSLSLALKNVGWKVAGCSSATLQSAVMGAEWLACKVISIPADLQAGIPVILAVPEGVLPEVDRKMAKEDPYLKNRVIFHLSGALPSRSLESCRMGGASVGSLHPIMTLPDPVTGARRLRQATFAIEGRPEAMSVMRSMAQSVSGRFFTMSPKGKVLYHAAAVAASNYLVALLSESQDLLVMAGADPSVALPAFESLVQGTIENIYASGPVQAMTGPIERGDESTVKAHIKALKRWPERQELYRVLGRKALELARRRHPEKIGQYASLEKILL